MTVEEILEKLTFYDETFPREALEQAIEQREAITPHLLEALRYARSHVEELSEDYCLHTWALYLLAQFRETRAYPLVVEVFDLPDDVNAQLHGDIFTEDGSKILAAVCGGDTSLIEQLAEKPEADEVVRSVALGALVALVAAGQKSREEVLEYFRHLLRTAQAEVGSYFWGALLNHATQLYPDLVYEEIQETFQRGLVDPLWIRLNDVDSVLAKGKDAVLAELARNPHYRLVEDTIEETEEWHCFQTQPDAPPRVLAPPVLTPISQRPASARPVSTWTGARVPPATVGVKPGRNAPCPCGSGLKYKKCCLKARSG